MPTCSLSLRDRSYSIHIGKNLLSETGYWIRRLLPGAWRAIVVTQKEIALYYQTRLAEILAKEGWDPLFFITPKARSSEAAKTLSVYLRLIKKIAEVDGKGKAVFLIALGGGVIGDLTGFAAAVYRRGIPYIQIPTTLTAQVDSAIGGKTAIDLPEGKNLLGSVYHPALVVSDVSLLSSLSERNWSDGFSEVIKYGVIKDPVLFHLLERHGKEGIQKNHRLLEKIILRCAKTKAKIVEKDEYDKKEIRMMLNFGHTAGHAIEAISHYSRQYTHGEAVAIGMLVACDIARELGILEDKTLTERMEKIFVKFQLPLFYQGLTAEALWRAMGYDKKAERGINRFVLPVTLGKTMILRDVPVAVILKALQNRKR